MKAKKSHLALARKELARAGGIARAKALSSEKRIEISSLGGRAGGRGRRKDDLIPDELREKIWALIKSEKGKVLWWMTDEARHPRTRSTAKRTLQSFAQYSSLHSFKAAHELAKCL